MTHPIDYQYLDLMRALLDAPERQDRTGTGTRSIWSPPTLYADLTQGFPLLTSKRIFWRGVVEELLWFIRGEHNATSLQQKGIRIWDAWAKEGGELGPVYGAQWRSWGGWARKDQAIDQLAILVRDLLHHPTSRRHIVSAWNVTELPDMALPPCHMMFQCYVDGDNGLHLRMYQRSADVFLGLPFNIASYALLTHILASLCGYTPKSLRIDIADAHLYLNHQEQARQQLSRLPLICDLPTPQVEVLPDPQQLQAIRSARHPIKRAAKALDTFSACRIRLTGYEPLPAIQAPISV